MAKPKSKTPDNLFEVWKDGARKMVTNDPLCVPSGHIIKQMKEAGYKIKRKDKDNER